MALRTQRAAQRLWGPWRVAVGGVALGAALLIGMGTRPAVSPAPSARAVTHHVPSGVDAPHGIPLRLLPAGYRDYIRVDGLPKPDVISSRQVLGIDLPGGATLDDLPAGVADYVRRVVARVTRQSTASNPELGIDLPSGARVTDLPAGASDYLRDDVVP